MEKSESPYAILVELLRPLIYDACRQAVQELNYRPPDKDSPPLTIEQMADRLDCSHSTIRRMIKAGAPRWRHSRRIYMDEKEFLDWMKSTGGK